MFTLSGRGTPTDTHPRRFLVPLCKCDMIPMLILRTIGFIFAVVALVLTDRFCNCAFMKAEELQGRDYIFSSKRACVTDERSWYIAIRLLIATMACDVFFPLMSLLVVMRKRIYKWYRRIRPRERTAEEKIQAYEICCKRFCECSALLTCYMCGGQHLTAGSYADVAMALTDFVDGEGSLDIVPSDIAAALICLVNLQKQKQIDCKNELVNEGGLFAKDRQIATRLYRQFFKLDSTSAMYRRAGTESIHEVSASLERSVTSDDIESGGPLGSIQPTDMDLERLRQLILTRRESMQKINFSLVRKEKSIDFEPMVSKVLSPQSKFDCLMLGEGSRYCSVALASYSWMIHLWTNKCTGCCTLSAGSIYGLCTCQPRCKKSDICGWKQATILKSLNLDETDLLYANFRNEVGINPYLILRDRKWKTLVLTIRGTLSFEDMISDVTVTPISLEELGKQFGFDGIDSFCHAGMLRGAQFIYNDLQTHNILTDAIKENPDYGVRIVGHSLGE